MTTESQLIHRARTDIGQVVSRIEKSGDRDLALAVADRMILGAQRLLDHAGRFYRSDTERHRFVARTHACKRIWQRFHVAMNLAELGRLEDLIRQGGARAEWILDLEGPRQAYALAIGRRRAVVIFDIRLDAIATALANENWLREYRRDQ